MPAYLEAANGGTLQIDDAVSGGSAIIAGGTLTFDAQSEVSVTFDNGVGTPTYGELVIGHAPDFSGQIFGFAGTAPDTAHSDAIDLKDISFGSNITFVYDNNAGADTGGTLTISDSGNTVDKIAFANGDYTTASFTLSSDGSGGTLITDPPVPTPAAAATPPQHNSANTVVGAGNGGALAGTGGHDNFVFNVVTDTPAGDGHFDTITNFTPMTADHDTIDFSSIAGITDVQGLIANGAQVAAHSVAWIQNGTTTDVYANLTGSPEAGASADLAIHLASITAIQLAHTDFILHT